MENDPEEKGVRISDEVFQKLGPLAAQLGIDLQVQAGTPGKPTAPLVDLKKTLLPLIMDVGQIVRGEGLYLKAGRVVTIDADGKEEEMTEKAFISWLPKHCVIHFGNNEDGKPKRTDMTAKKAGEILASSMFRSMLPEVTRVLPSRLPVYTDDRRGVRLLPKGYDPEHRVFVTATAPSIEDWDLERSVAFLRELLKGFEWGDSGRSLAAQISGMVGMFVQMLFPDAIAVPLYYFNANQEGSGKSILAEMFIASIYGYCTTDDFDDGDEFEKMLSLKVGSFASYLFLDDLEGFIKSQTLNRWVVQSRWSWRKMHTLQGMDLPKKIMTLLTGNQTTLTNDLVRRAVMIDLFTTTTAAERLAKRTGQEITSDWLALPGTRTKFLSALWALVRHWAAKGMPEAPRKIASFVEWTSVVGGIVVEAGFGDPFEPAKLADAGDKWQVEFEKMFAAVVRKFEPTVAGTSVPLPEWCAVARELGLYVDKLGDLELTLGYLEENQRLWKIPPTDFTDSVKLEQAKRYMHPQKQASPWAKILRKRGGQVFDVDGKKYRFADRHTSTSTFVVYLVE